MVDYPDAISCLVDQRRVFINQNSHSAITIHGTGGSATQTAQQLGDYFRTTSDETSSHFGIDRTGNIAQYVLLKDGSGANCCKTAGHDTFWDQFNGENLNLHTISLEHVNDAENSLPLTDPQKQASFKLIAWLCDKYDIPLNHIKSHASIDPINRSLCPGPAFPWADLYAFLIGGSMATLENFPMISQLDSDANAQYDCVAASIAAALQFLTGKTFTGAQVKDTVYGSGYIGNTDPDKYANYCAQHGVQLSPINGTDNTALIAATKLQLAAKHPVLLTEVDPYLPVSSGETHVVVAYACNADSITVMDPFIDAPVTKTDQQWQNDLRSNQIWIMEKSMVPAGWKDSGATLTAPNGITVTLGFRDYILNNNWPSGNWPIEEAHAESPLELSNPGLGSGTQQVYRWSVLEWTPTQGVFIAWSGQELLKMRALLAQDKPTTPVANINVAQAVSTIQTVQVALQTILKDLEPS